MAVLLFFGVLLQSFLAIAQDSVSPTNAPWQITGSSAYNSVTDQTVFSYKVNSYSNGFVSYLHVGIPSCPEVKCVGNKQYTVDSQSGIRGFKLNQDVRPGRSWIYTVSVEGMVETGEISYSVGGTRVSSGIQNYHQYSQSTIVGPKCSVTPKISCSISQNVFHGQCVGNTVRIPLSTTTQHYTSLRWSTDYAGCSFSQSETANPVVTFHGPICDTQFQVYLEVWGPNGQYEMCSTWVAATDNTPPTFGGIWGPQDVTVSCDDIPAPLHVVAKDTCDNDVQVTFSEVEEDVQYGEYSIYRTWTATDDCDNKATYNQLVVVADVEPPTLVGVPDDATIDCGLDVKPCVVVARDNCDEVTVERQDEVLEGSCVDSWKVIRTWIAEDSSHNAVTAHQTVSVQDNEDPEFFGIPDDVTVECHEVPANVVPSALDNCQEDLDISSSERIVPGSCADAYTIYRSFSVGDECGNHLTVDWVVTVVDTTPPSMSDIVSDHGRQPCDQIPVPCAVDATDNCAVYTQQIVPAVDTDPGSCVNEYVLIYTWTATDNCGNTADTQSSISVYDDTPPKFSVKLPENLRSTCTHAPVVNVRVTDDCGVPSLDYLETLDSSTDYAVICDYNYRLYRTWTATDECGNSDVMAQTVTVVDDVPPLLVGLPPDMTLPCDQPINFDDLSVTGIDNCDCVNAVDRIRWHKEQGTCPDHTIEIYRWSVTDCCGHGVEEFRTVTYYDDTPPRLHGIPGSIYTSIENINGIQTPTVTGTDNCADLILPVPESNTLLGSCPHNYKIVNTWSAEDDCGNSVTMSQTVYCDDTTPPIFDEPNYDNAVECPLSGHTIITATDNSPIYEVGLKETRETVPGRCEDEYSVLRHFVATDPCGNTAMKTYTVYVYDTQAPNWSKLPHQEDLYIVIDTLEAYNANYVDDVSAWDLCAQEVDVEFEETISQMSCENEYVIRRKWTAADNCGNSVSISRTVDVQDQTPPKLIDVPADASVDCTDDYANMYVAPTAEDYGYSGDLDISTRTTIIAGECRNSYTAVKCWTVHDCVGQHDVECQTITITDTGPPSFVYTPPHTTVPCYDIPEPVDLSTAGIDDCGSVVVTRREVREAGTCENDYLIIHTYTVVDECDLTTTFAQTITVVDEDAPYFDFVPADQSLECGSFSRYVKATCVDTCDYTLEITNDKKSIEGTCEDETIDIRIWVCADDCGNEVTAEQSITFSDIIPPRFNFFPRDLSLPCRDGVSAIPSPPPIRANDNCDTDVDVELTEHIKPGAYGFVSSTNIRVWIATDNCGNTAEMHQTVIIYDNIAPVVTIPQSFELDCTEEYVTPTIIQVTDNCDPAPVVDTTVLNPYALCIHSYIKEYEWCPRDKSGNVGTCKTMRVTVIDTGVPQWTSSLPPLYQKISYTDTWGPASLTATDYCDGDITVTWDSDGSLDMPCPLEERVVYNYHASDICGNTISYSQTIIVSDDVPPPLTPKPEHTSVECPAELPSPEVLISEDPYAYEPYRVEYFQQDLITTCDQEVIVERRWTVKDCAFNVAEWVQTIKILDTTAPSLPQMDDKTLPCEEDDYVGIEAYDACDDYVDVQFLTDTVEGDCSSTVYRHWIATDDCGNVDNEYQTIYVYDDEKPQLYGAPLDVVVDNHNIPGSYVLQCSDNCVNDMFSAEFAETTEPGSCEHEWTINRKWTCTDECGKKQVSIQIVNVIDNEAPEISYCPSDITVQLGLVPPPPTLTAIDAQVYGDVPVIYHQDEETAYRQEIMQILYRSWTATDACSNVASCEQTITVIDTVPPIIPDVPRDTYLDCDDIIVSSQEEWDIAYGAITTRLQDSIASVEQVDITPNSPPYPFEKIPGTCKGEYSVKRTWTATDHAGNSLSDTQVLQIVDDQPPVFSWECDHEPSIHAECEHDPPCNPTVTDNCDDFVFPNLHEKRIKGTCPNEYTLIRLWDSRDSCGNMVSAKQTVYVGDSDPPVLSDGPDDEVYECTFYTTLPTPAELTCTDTCDGDIDVKFHSTKHLGNCSDSWVILRTWSCADVCGHEVHYTQTITTEDTTDPEFEGLNYDIDVTIPCEQEPPSFTPTATDNCAEYVQVHSEFVGYTIGYIISEFTQRWTAYDNCGNSASKVRTITVEDTIDPVISPRPPSQVIPCNQYSAYEMPEPHCDDNCGIATIERVVTTLLGTCESEYDLEVVWSCVDQHSNSNEHTMVISVVDNESPVIDVKGFEIEAPCDDVPPAPTGTASDNCDYVTVDYSENAEYPEYILGSVASPLDFTLVPTSNLNGYMPDYYSISPMAIHSYKIARGSGMGISLNHCDFKCMLDPNCYGAQLWSVSGEAPFRCYLYDQAHICEVQHEGYKIPDSQSDLTYRSNTGNWIIKSAGVCDVDPEPVHLCDRYNLVRTWTAEDLCGNHAEVVQSIRVWDDTPPVWDVVPNDATEDCTVQYNALPECDESNPELAACHGIRAPEATDDCTFKLSVTETYSSEPGDCDTNYVGTYTWTVADTCGNVATAKVKVTKLDDTPPTIAYVSPDEDVECVTPIIPPADPDCVDDCNEVTVTSTSSAHSGTCDYQLIYVWTCTDDCGNSATTQQRLNIADTTPPTFDSVPDDETFPCETPVLTADDFDITCSDVCGGCSVSKSVTTSIIDCPNNALHIWRFIASDDCGNRVEAWTTLTYLDLVPPTLADVPDDYTVNCSVSYDDIPVSCTDECGSCIVKYSESTVDYDCESSSMYHIIYRSWTATDLCGHVSVASQTVTVTDGSFPVINTPNDRTIECDDQIPVVSANANDDCGPVTLSDYSTTVEGTCEDEYKIIKTWLAVDLCGNKQYEHYTLTVQDTQDPQINGVPANEAVACDQVPDVPNVLITDECSYPVPHYDETSDRDGYGCNEYEIVRAWSGSDDCGNTVFGSYTITVTDGEAPVLTCNGADDCEDVAIECEIYPTLPTVVAHDNCYEHLEVTYSATPDAGSCEHDHQEFRLWVTQDGCGLQDEVSQTITYFDNTPPVLEGLVKDVTVECPNTVPVPPVTSNDNCDYALSVDYTDDQVPGPCKGVYVEYRRWTSDDLCGNTDWIAQTVTVEDTTAPSLDVYASHAKVECDRLADAWHGVVTASDDCDYDMTVKFTEEKFDGTCLDTFTLVRRWSTEDCSGNTATHVQTVYVQDTLPPYFLGTVPQDITVSQGDVYSGSVALDVPSYEADDNCADPVVQFSEVEIPMDYECDYMYYIVRTWSLEDDCGNTASMTQTIDMVQTEAPMLTQPEDVTVECDSVPPPCDVSIIGDAYQATLTFFESKEDGTCENEYELIRTWTATDCAYNSGSVTQTVSVRDRTPPTFTRFPDDVTGECDCDEIFTVPVLDVVDNCGLGSETILLPVPGMDPVLGSCEDSYTIHRLWITEDACGNSRSITQDVTVVDSTAPVFCDCPNNYDMVDFECDEIPVLDPPSVMDNCDDDLGALIESHSEFIGDDDECETRGYYAYSWLSYDNCGNEDECLSTIRVIDTKPPHVVNGDQFCYPLNGYGPTSNEWAVYDINDIITCADTCDDDPDITFVNCTYASDPSECVDMELGDSKLYVHMVVSVPEEEYTGRYYTVWFEATDKCGNAALVKRIIWVPATPFSYEEAVNRGLCPYGIGTDNFAPSIPVLSN